MFYQLKDKYRRLRFQFACKFILKSKPVATVPSSGVALLTQLQHKDVLLALIALKTFSSQVPVGSFHILNDGSLTSEDIALLGKHFENVIFHSMDAARSDCCPTGGCWERLLTIAELVKNNYVIQLDSDTLTLAKLPEIIDCINANKSFVIGTWDNQNFEPMPQRQEQAYKIVANSVAKPHIQVAAEANFDKIKRFNELRYVRGCAGFTGFGKQSFDRSFVDEISGQMLEALGDRWREWGSEQVMSNIVVANTKDVHILPHPKYCDCTMINKEKTVFIHFIGSCRFSGGIYARLAKKTALDLG
ncbi:MAG: hypothetical protein Q7V00_04730 [Sulfurimicrobium sp.]|nr:hypothetical protein [Sulfurimicrobium sp.]MDP1703265.1 hypothetical protein [Sulfurimicrobium sp.]MDP2198608.1 hypothetical protein [Sulfurimicrobium sp.]